MSQLVPENHIATISDWVNTHPSVVVRLSEKLIPCLNGLVLVIIIYVISPHNQALVAADLEKYWS